MNTNGYWERIRRFCIAAVICCFALGCGGSFDTAKCLIKAQEKYPTATIIPDKKYAYIAVDDKNNVHYIEVMSDIEKGITYDAIIIKAQNCR